MGTTTVRRRWRRAAGGVVAAYLAVVAVIAALQNRFIFHPVTAESDWEPPFNRNTRDVYFTSDAGDRIHAWWQPSDGARGALLYSHGNAGNLSHRGFLTSQCVASLQQSVLIYDYPGFGHSTGRPSEEGCYAAGRAAWDWLTGEGGVAPERVTLWGKSLGAGVAVELARQHPHRALVLIRPFTSIPDVAANLFPWMPARFLVRAQFDNLAKIGECGGPVFIHTAGRDRLTPRVMSERLFAAASDPKALDVDPDAEHESMISPAFFLKLRDFLDVHAPD